MSVKMQFFVVVAYVWLLSWGPLETNQPVICITYILIKRRPICYLHTSLPCQPVSNLCPIRGPLGLALLGPSDAWQADRSVYSRTMSYLPEHFLLAFVVVSYWLTYHSPCFFLSDIVRVGSRSKNEALSRCNLRNRRVRKSTGLFHAYNDLRAKRETFLVSVMV